MKNARRSPFAWLVACVVLLLGCQFRQLPTAEQLAATGRAPEAEVAVLRHGRAMMLQTCMDCHRMYWPEEFRPASWQPLMRRMAGRASLGKEDTEALTRYVMAAADEPESDR